MIYVITINESSRVDLETLFHDNEIMFTRRSLGKKAVYVAELDSIQYEIISTRYSGVKLESIDGVADYLVEHGMTEPTQPKDYDESEFSSISEEDGKDAIKFGTKVAIAVSIVVLVIIAISLG